MGLLDEAASVLRSFLADESGFSVSCLVRSPLGQEATMRGLGTDIGLTIDPDTGVAVSGRKASVALPLADLVTAGLSIPEGIPDEDEKPWLVTLTLPSGGTTTYKVIDSTPDRLGLVVLHLGKYRT